MDDSTYNRMIIVSNFVLVLVLFLAFIFSISSPEGDITGMAVRIEGDGDAADVAESVKDRVERYPEAVSAIETYSSKYNVPEPLVYALITQESRGKVGSESTTGAMGLMQVQWNTAKEVCPFVQSAEQLAGKNSIENNIRCGIAILADKYAVNKDGEDPFDCGWDKYTGWKGALRGYNGMCCTYTDDSSCSACHSDPGRCDDDYVEHVLKYYPLFGGGDSELLKDVKIPEKTASKQYDSKGDYEIQPKAKAEIDYDLRKYGFLKSEATTLVDECSLSNNVTGCIKEKIKTFDNNWTLGGCGSDYEDLFYSTAERFYQCVNSTSDDCVCELEFPEAPFLDSVQEIGFSMQSGSESFEMISPASYMTNVDGLDKEIYYANDKLSDARKIDFANLYVNYRKSKPDEFRLVGMTSTDSGTAEFEASFDNLFIYNNGSKIIFSKKKFGKEECDINKRVYKFCVRDENKVYVDSGSYAFRKPNIKLALTILDKIPPEPIRSLIIEDTENKERNVTLEWELSSAKDVSKYKIYLKESDFDVTDEAENVKTVEEDVNNVTLPVENDGKNYYFAVTAVDQSGNEEIKVFPRMGHSVDDLSPGKVKEIMTVEKKADGLKFEWKKPENNSDGSELEDLAGFRLLVADEKFNSVSEANIVENIKISKAAARCAGSCSFKLYQKPDPGKYFYTVIAYDDDGNEYKGDVDSVMLVVQP